MESCGDGAKYSGVITTLLLARLIVIILIRGTITQAFVRLHSGGMRDIRVDSIVAYSQV